MAKKATAAKTADVNLTEVGRNVKVSIEGDTLLIEVDLSKKSEPSGSGKTLIIATTQGNKKVGGVHVGLNVYTYPDGGQKK